MRRTQAAAFDRRVSFLCLHRSSFREISKFLAIFLLIACASWPASASNSTDTDRIGLLLPLTFEPNHGQAPAEAQYLARGAEGSVLLNKRGIVALLGSGRDASALHVRFIGSNLNSALVGENPTGGIANYYGSGRKLENIPFYTQLRLKDVYAGTDVVFHGRTGRLEYDFELAPHANPGNILIDVSDAESVKVQQDRSLLLTRDGKQLQMLAPQAFQEINGKRVAVEARYKLAGSRVAFELGQYDVTKPLVIDPVVAYTALFRVSGFVDSKAGFADSAGNFYFAGETTASDFPVSVGNPPIGGSRSAAFLMKINSAGTAILVSTVIESSGAFALASDPAGNLYLAGSATEGFTPTAGPIPSCSDSCSGFVVKLNSSGQMVYSTLLATGNITPYAIAADSDGNAYITGRANDDSLATVNAFQAVFQSCSGCSNAFFAKLNSTGSGYEFASYFGLGYGQSIALDQSKNIYLAGSGVVPLVNPVQIDGNNFVAKFSPDAQTLLSSTQFSGVSLSGMGVGSDGTVYLAGTSSYPDFPWLLNSFRLPTVPSVYFGFDKYMFAAALKPDFSGLTYSTYLGQGTITAVTLGADEKLYVAGSFGYEPLALKNPVVSDGGNGGFVLSVDKTGTLANATQYGGRYALQVPTAMGVDGSGNLYLTGRLDGKNPINIGTGSRYEAQQVALSPYTTFISKLSATNAAQISLSLYLPSQILRNVGSSALNIQSMTLVSQGTKKATSCGTSLPAGASCILTLTPYGTVTINTNAQPAAQTYLPLTIDSNVITLWTDREQLYFGLQYRDESSPTQSFKLWNVSTSAVPITAISSSGPVTQSNNCPGSLEPEEYCTIQVSLAAHSTADWGAVVIESPGMSPISVPAVTYFTVNRMVAAPQGVGFGAQLVGPHSLNRLVNITNSSNSSFNLVYSLTGASEFAIAGTTCGASLAPRASCSIALSFTPTVSGPRSAQLVLSSGDSSTTVQVTGSGAMNSAIRVDPLGLTFVNAIVGKSTYPQSVTLTNTSGNPVNVTGIQFSSPHYIQTNTCQSAIPPAGTCKIDVSMQPQDVVSDSSTMKVTFDTATEQVISISGSSVFPIDISPPGLTFGNTTPVGVDSNPRWLYLGNGYPQGDEETNYSLSLTGDFKIIENHCPNPLIKYHGCALVIVFHPETPGTQEGALTVSIPGLPAKRVAPLSGTAASAGVKISPEAIDFPETMDTTKSAPKTITLYNPQTFAVNIPSPTLSGEHFEFTNNCATIQPGASCEIPVVFSPSGAGFVSANLFFENGGTPPTTIRVGLTGVGSPAPGLSFTTTRHNFNSVDAGTSSTPFAFTITNLGPHAVALPALSMTGTNAADFVATPDAACSSIPSQGSCDVQIVFSPKKSGLHSAMLSLPSGGTNPYTIKLYLDGAGRDFAVSSSSGDQLSKSIASGQSATFSLRVQRQGYTGEIQLQCAANGASYGSCTASPSIVPSSSEDSDVSISIGPTSAAARPKSSHWPYALAALLPGLLLAFGTNSRVRGLALLAICFLGVSSCGGGGGGGSNPPSSQGTTYRYTVTFTGSASHAVTLTVTVK